MMRGMQESMTKGLRALQGPKQPLPPPAPRNTHTQADSHLERRRGLTRVHP
jgi:hypothetical protein